MSEENEKPLRIPNETIEEMENRITAMHQKNKELNKVQKALELRKTLQIFLSTLDPNTNMDTFLSVPSVFPKFQPDKEYKINDIFSYGTNSVGDPQLYVVTSDHTSAASQAPNALSISDRSAFPYKPLGLDENGLPKWVEPLGKADGYSIGDVVGYEGKIYESLNDNNMSKPTNENYWKLRIN